MLVVAVSIAAAAGVRALNAQAPGTWKSLFNKDLTGWISVQYRNIRIREL
jgi:hypothetical protein